MSPNATSAPVRRRGTRVLGVLGAALVAVVAVVLGARAMVGHVAASALRERGLDCAPVTLDPWLGLDGLDIAATACRPTDARLASITLPYGGSVSLGDGWRPRSVHAPEVTVELAGEADLGSLGGALLEGAVPVPLAEALSALAAASSGAEISAVELDVARVGRAGVTLELRGITLTRDAEGTRVTVRELTLPLHHGRIAHLDVRVEAVEVRASPAEVSVEGRLRLDARLVARELDAAIPFHVTGTDLDVGAARWTLSVETSLDLGDVRARIEALRARRERTPGGAPLERIGELADRLGALRERVEASDSAASAEVGAAASSEAHGPASSAETTAGAAGTTAPAAHAPGGPPPLDPAAAGP